MTALQIPKKRETDKTRADTVRERRSPQTRSKPASQKSKTGSRQVYQTGSVLLPREPRRIAQHRTPVTTSKGRQMQGSGLRAQSMARQTQGRMGTLRSSGQAARRNAYDMAFTLGRTSVHAPTISLPQLGPRWISAGLTLILGLMVYSMLTANTFIVSGAEVSGNQRLSVADVSAALGVTGQPIFKAIPTDIEQTLRTAFPDLASVSVKVGLPNRVYVSVVERTPVLVWSQGDNNITWIDSNGVQFMPRGNMAGLIPIAATGNPPKVAPDAKQTTYGQAFISPAMVQAIQTLYPQVPTGSPMIYDPKYGMGWQDPRGWSVYFGQNTQDIPMKEKVYQAILDTITNQGIQPTMIDVEYLDAPFYK